MIMRHSRAFTLLEMVVAIGIFAVIAIISYTSLNRFLDNRDVLQTEIETMKELQLAFSLLEQDMHFISGRIVRDAYGDPEPLLMINNLNVVGELLRFTTARRSVSLPDTSVLQRTAYRWENGEFIRVNWQVLDRDQDSREIKHLLLSEVQAVSVNVLQSVNGIMQPSVIWDTDDKLPDGVEWNIQLADGKQYRRVFEIKSNLTDSQ